LPSAVSDCGFAFGFTRRTREPAQRIQDLDEAVAMWRTSSDAMDRAPSGGESSQTAPPKTALVFGRESQGLFCEETLVLSHLVRIPMPDELLSLNLSHAVAIGLYAFLGSGNQDPETAPADGAESSEGLPTRAENAAFLENLMSGLEQRGFFRGGKEAAQRDYVRILWQRLQPTRREMDFLAGMFKRLSANS
jgi:tRNA C32,U32 (ribose-2'-O)-methylase TrmJ